MYRVRRITDGKDYALKRVKLAKLSDKERENALNEVRILASIRNPNVIAYKEAFFEEKSNSLWYSEVSSSIIMEYCDGSDLYAKIVENKKRGTYFSESDIWSVLIQMLKGLSALHAANVYHRDLKVVMFHKECQRFHDKSRRSKTW